MKSVHRIRSVMMGLGLAIGLSATVAAQDVKTDYDKTVDFSKYKTFSADVVTKWGNPFGEKRALDEVEKALVGKRWTKAPATSADALVMIHGATQTKRDLNTFYSGGYYRYGGGMATTTVNEFQVGTMLVDIVDAKTKSLIWRGVGSDEISDKPEKNEKKIAKATEKMFKNFPPKPGAK